MWHSKRRISANRVITAKNTIMANFFDNDERPTATEEVKEEQKEEVQNVENEEPLEEEEIVNDYGQEES